jgi:hypothetical protein
MSPISAQSGCGSLAMHLAPHQAHHPTASPHPPLLLRHTSAMCSVATIANLKHIQPLALKAQSIPCMLQECACAFHKEAFSNNVQRWKAKLQCAAAGEQLWAKITAAKPAMIAHTPQHTNCGVWIHCEGAEVSSTPPMCSQNRGGFSFSLVETFARRFVPSTPQLP